MQPVKRYAVYYAPRAGAFADRAAAWLGRDAVSDAALVQPRLAGVAVPPEKLTADPRRYGFHGTIRAPFRPGAGVTGEAVAETVRALAARLAPVSLDGLRLENLDGFLALTPEGPVEDLLSIGAAVVEGTEGLRAALTPDEIARRRPEALTARQRDLLGVWGYPYVMEEFRFHLTLTDRLPASLASVVAPALEQHFAPVLPRPFVIEDLCLFGETAEGTFRLLHRHALTG
jgi:hypothetical protein